MWDYNYMRLSITFIAIWGDDIVPVKKEIPKDDEQFLTVTLPERLKRRTYSFIHVLCFYREADTVANGI